MIVNINLSKYRCYNMTKVLGVTVNDHFTVVNVEDARTISTYT